MLLLTRVISWPLVLLTAWSVGAALVLADPDQAPQAANEASSAPETDDQPPAAAQEPAKESPEAEDATEEPAQDSPQEGGKASAEEQPEPEPMPGQADLDKATALKLTAKDGRQISEVIKLLASALKKGLDEDNTEFAEQMLASTLMERGKGLAQILLSRPSPTAAQDPRWVQLRLIALSDLTNAVKLDPNEYEGFLLIGRLQYLPGGDAKLAATALSKVIAADQAEAKLKAQAYALRSASQEEEADKLADLTKAIELDASNTAYRLLRARQLLADEAYDQALADIDAAIESTPEDYAAHELRGVVLTAMGDNEAALLSFDRASELDADNAVPYLQRSELYSKLGNYELGIDEATKAIARSEDNPLGYLLRGDLYLRSKQYEKSLADADKVLKLRPGLASAVFLKARAYDEMGDTLKAMDQLEALAAAIPDRMEVNLQIAIYALKLEMPRRAITALDRAIAISPDEPLLYRYRGDARLNISEHAKAIEDYEKALELDPKDSGVLNNFAWTLATSSDKEIRDGKRAIELATKACELTDYELAHILSTLAAAYAEAGNFDKAKEWARKAVDRADPDDEEQLAAELASYERGEPWRENKQLDAGEREGAEPAEQPDERRTELEGPSSSSPAPRRSIDF